MRRSFAHWTPRYVAARGREVLDHARKPDDPWLTRAAIDLLDGLLRPTDIACEFGAGRSTPWIARRVASMTSVEDDMAWHRRVAEALRAADVSNVALLHRPFAAGCDDGPGSEYVRAIDRYAHASVDFFLIDGRVRNHCALAAVAKTKPGGLIVIDNANWYLPSASRSPNSRSLDDGPRDDVWRQFAEMTRGYRRIWTSSGVTDTLILFKC